MTRHTILSCSPRTRSLAFGSSRTDYFLLDFLWSGRGSCACLSACTESSLCVGSSLSAARCSELCCCCALRAVCSWSFFGSASVFSACTTSSECVGPLLSFIGQADVRSVLARAAGATAVLLLRLHAECQQTRNGVRARWNRAYSPCAHRCFARPQRGNGEERP